MPSQLAHEQEIQDFVGAVQVSDTVLDDAVNMADTTITKFFGPHPIIDTIDDSAEVQASKRDELNRRKWGLFRLILLNLQARETGSPIFDNTGLVDASNYNESRMKILEAIGMVPAFEDVPDA